MSAPVAARTPLDGSWEVDTTTARAVFVARDLLRRPVTGTLDVTRADVDVVDGVPTRATARLDLGSVDTGSTRRDRDLRGPRFFDVEGSPDLVFSAGPARPVPGGWQLPGVLVLRGVECAVLLDVEALEAGPLDAEALDAGGDVTVRATATVDRRDLGITVPRVLVAPLVSLTVTAVLRRVRTHAGPPTP